MIGKPEWFGPRKFGWGLGLKKWQGIAYVMAIAFIYGVLFASPIDNAFKVGAAVVLSAIIIADMLQVMYKVYSNLDEREEKHQLVAERNASFTAVALVGVYVLYIAFNAAMSKTAPSFEAMALPIALLLAMSVAKGGTLLLLEREG